MSDRVERIRRIVLLLETKDGYVPTPRAHELAAEPGPAPSRRVPCSCARLVDDGGPGNARLVGVPRCALCGGRGWRERIRELDGDVDDEEKQRDDRGLVFDEYTYANDLKEHPQRARLFGASPTRTMTAKEIDGELARLRRQELVRNGVTAAEAFGWERARKARDRAGSYVEVERALEQLRDVDGEAYTVVVRAYVERRYGLPPALAPPLRAVLMRGLGAIEQRMPRGEVRLPEWIEDRLAAEHRRASIDELLDRGWKTSRIARELGITQETVKRVVRRRSSSPRAQPIQRPAGAPERAA